MVIRVMMLMVLLFVNNANAFFWTSKKLLFLSHFQ
ncbi:type-F conjugative transfer system pilin assembly protein TrbC [Orientia tsutsugamushi]|nr:hypothetical protein OTSTA763_2678 [Orientia tsutsugamushi str. TA763]SPR14176.1 type-F conjugative transfer system pilin assembly protein TrbC [Orientia tsutsugamushi]